MPTRNKKEIKQNTKLYTFYIFKPLFGCYFARSWLKTHTETETATATATGR